MRKQSVFVFLVVIAAAGQVLAILPDETNTNLRLIKNRSIITPPDMPGGFMSDGTQLGEESGQKLTTVQETNGALKDFLARAGQGLLVRLNPVTGAPSLIVGRSLALPGVKILTKENVERACLDFVAVNTNLLKVSPGQLRLANKIKAGGRWFVTFQQVHDGVPVLGGKLCTSFTKDDRLIMLTSDIYPDITLQTKPKLDKKQAVRVASAECGGSPENYRISEVQLCIMPLRQPDGFDYVLCWKLYIYQPTLHKKWLYLIDAASGRIVGKANALVYQNVTGTVQGEYKPEFASEPNQVAAFPHEIVSAQGPEFVIASWNFDTDPGWTTEGQWTFGSAAAGGNLCGDPISAYSGTNIYGYNIGGDYENNMPEYHLTTLPIDCSNYENVHLKFMRWLGVESSYYDRAAVEVSNDGVNWTAVWENPGDLICDQEWVSVSYDISTIADLQTTVYVRWVMGPTDSSVVYPGWSIDDVQIVSILGGINIAGTQGDGSYTVAPPWSPCTITSELKGAYCDINYDCGTDAQFIQQQVDPNDVVDFTWDSTFYNKIAESSAYWHINYVHDYFTAIDPGLSEASSYFPLGLDYPMSVVVQLGCTDGYCNAYWDGDGISLGAGDGVFCDDFGLYSEIIYHEYTHAVTSKIYDGIYFPYTMEPGAMDEAWSDYFGNILTPSQSPLVGEGGALLNEPNGFRTLDNNYRRETDWVSEVHADSQMFGASLWDARQAIEKEISVDTWDQMVHFARYAHPQSFEEYLLAVLTEDDARYGDNNLSNGTPHAEVIYKAFGNHGIGGLQYVAPSLVVNDSVGNANGKIEPGEIASLSLTLTNGWANATSVQAKLSTTDTFVVVIKGTANFPAVNHGGKVNNAADPFITQLKPDCPETHTINFTLDITANGPYTYSRTSLFTYTIAVNQLIYSDGQADGYVGYGGKDGALAVRVTPQSYPYYPTSIRFFPYEDCTITVRVWDNDGPRGSPGTMLGSVSVDAKATGDWFDVDISSLGLRIDSGSFYVGWVEGQCTFYNGLDTDPPYYQRSWVYFPMYGAWMTFEYVGLLGNLMISVRECSIADAPVANLNTGRRYCGIQTAINTARNGDRIVVGIGTYYENINFKGKSLIVASTDPDDSATVAQTIIKGGDEVVSFSGGEGEACILDGFTITGGNKGIYCSMASPVIKNCLVTANTLEGICANETEAVIANCTITGNGAGGISVNYGSKPMIRNCTIVSNREGGIIVNNSTATVVNSIIWGNWPKQVAGTRGSAVISYSDVQSGWPALGNISTDPCFVSAGFWADPNDPNTPVESNEPNVVWVQGDYHLRSQGWRWDAKEQRWDFDRVTSRAIDAGNPGSPLGGELTTIPDDPDNRWGRNVRIDMGAYGGTAEASMPPHRWSILGDLTNDGIVDLTDFILLVDGWLNSGSELYSDFSRDIIVNLDDFARFAEDWGAETSWHN